MSIVVGIVIARYVALPTIGVFVIWGAQRVGFLDNDPLYTFVLLIQYAVPPAMNIGTLQNNFDAS